MIITQSFRTKQEDGTFSSDVNFSTVSDLVFFENEENKTLTKKTSEIESKIQQEIDNRIAADTSIRSEFSAADAALDKKFSDENAAIRKEFADADTVLKSGYEAADTALGNRIDLNVSSINVLINDIKTINESTIPNAVIEANGYTDDKITEAKEELNNIINGKEETINNTLSSHTDLIDENTQKISGHDTRISANEQSIVSTNENVSTLTTDLDAIETIVENQTTAITDNENAILEIREDIMVITTAIGNAEEPDVGSILARLASIEARLTALENSSEA